MRKEAPGDSVQVDVKVIQVKRERVFQYTALDDCTRLRVLRLYRRQNQHSTSTFSRSLRGRTPIEKLRALLPDVNMPQTQLNVQ